MRAIRDTLRASRLADVVLWLAVAALAVWLAIRLLGLERGFPLVPIIAFTPYAALATIPLVALALALHRRAAAGAAAGIAAVFAILVLPRAFGGGGADVADGVPLRILSVNVEYGQADPQRVAELVAEHDADVLSVQELTRNYVPRLRRALGDRLPHELLMPAPRARGGGVLSSLPLQPAAGPTALPGGFALPRAIVAPPGAAPVEVVAVHASPPTDWGLDTWADDLRALPRAGVDPPLVLAGDFNATLDHGELRDLIDSGFTDAGDASGGGLVATWAEERRLPPLVTIDHVLADERLGVTDYAVDTVERTDHRAVFAALELPPESR